MNITQKSKLEALRNLIERIARASAGGIVYTTALLGIIYLFPGMKLPPELALIAGGVGVNAIAIILERLSQEEKKQDHENYVITVDHAYARLACNAISESGFKSGRIEGKVF